MPPRSARKCASNALCAIRIPSPPGPLAQLLAHADQLLTAASLGVPAPAPPAEEGGLEDRLLRLHAQESGRDTRATHLNLASNLVDRLVEGEGEGGGLAKLVVTLLPGDEGYILAIAQVTTTTTFPCLPASAPATAHSPPLAPPP